MNRAIPLLLFAALHACFGVFESCAAVADTVRIGGREYVSLQQWARNNDLDLRWLKRDESLQLSNTSFKLLLTVDSRETRLNGIQVHLLFPLIQRGQTVYLAGVDAATTLKPILSTPRNRPGAKIRSVCLDPGHGGKDPGNIIGSNQEKKYNLLLAQELRDQLTKSGLKVTLTRTTDSFIELDTRPELARRRNADLFVSLHFNAVGSSTKTVHGAEVYCLTPAGAPSTNAQGEGAGAGSFPGNRQNDKNMFLAYQLQKSLVKELGVEDRGVRRARYAVLRDAVMPAVLIEGGFLSHPTEGRKIIDPAYRRQMARAIANGLLAYKKIVEQGA